MIKARLIIGGPEDLLAGVQPLLDAGLDGMIFNFADSPNPDTIRLAGETLAPLLR